MTYFLPAVSGSDRMDFGMYKNKTYAEVLEDFGYTNWCIQTFQEGDCNWKLKRYAQWAKCQPPILPAVSGQQPILPAVSGSDRMDFGMHKDKTYAEVLEDFGYTNWCIQTFQEGDCNWKLKRYAQWAIRQQPILPAVSGSDRMDFGMYKNKTYAEVLEDFGYTNWCIQTFQEGDCNWKLKRYAQWANCQQPILPAVSGSDRMDFGMYKDKTYAEVLEDFGYTNWCIQTFQEGDCNWKLKRYAQWAIRQQPVVVVTSPESTSPSLGSYSMVSLTF